LRLCLHQDLFKLLPGATHIGPIINLGSLIDGSPTIHRIFSYHLYTKAELLQIQQSGDMKTLMCLSPAEKYDIYMGRYDYPTVLEEWSRTNSSEAEDNDWEGISRGWAAAAMQYAQPNAVNMMNADGIEVLFGSSDVKGLLSYYVDQYDTAEVKYVGRRCYSDFVNGSGEALPECVDLNAGAFHVIIANEIGLQHQGFVVDRERALEVWNQPVNSFKTRLGAIQAPQKNATNGTVHSVAVSTTMTYTKETTPYWTAHDVYEYSETYDYVLDLDGDGNIIGGSMNSFDRVDFASKQTSSPFFGYFASLKDIYVKSTGDLDHPSVANALSVGDDLLAVRLSKQ